MHCDKCLYERLYTEQDRRCRQDVRYGARSILLESALFTHHSICCFPDIIEINSLLTFSFENPVIRRRLLQQVVALALSGLPVTSRVPIELCESVLSWTPSVAAEQRGPAYNEALQDLQAAQARDLKVLALKFSDVLFVRMLLPCLSVFALANKHGQSVYQDLESALDSLHKSGALSRRMRTDYQAFLISIMLVISA